MSTTTANMGLTVPALDGDPGVWDTALNASLALLDLHDHTAGKGVKVPSAGININADLTFAGYSLTNLRAAVYTAQASFATAKATYVIGDDLYYRDGSSNQIRLTASGGINIATTGGFTGDYIASGAAAYYDDANETYRFLKAAPAPNNWSRVACGSVDLYEYGSGILTRVRLSSPAALGASYEVTFPAALPGSTLLTQVSSAGVMTWSNTIANAVTMSASLDVGTTLGVTGAATLSSTLGVTGLITATAGLTAAANQHVTVSGTGRFKHGLIERTINAGGGMGSEGSWSASSGGFAISHAVGTGLLLVAIPLAVGERVQTWKFAYYGNGVQDILYGIKTITLAGVATDILASTTISAPGASWATATHAVTHTALSENSVVMWFSSSAGANIRIGTITYSVDYP